MIERTTIDLMVDCRIKLEGAIIINKKIKNPSVKMIVNKIVMESALKSLSWIIENHG